MYKKGFDAPKVERDPSGLVKDAFDIFYVPEGVQARVMLLEDEPTIIIRHKIKYWDGMPKTELKVLSLRSTCGSQEMAHSPRTCKSCNFGLTDKTAFYRDALGYYTAIVTSPQMKKEGNSYVPYKNDKGETFIDKKVFIELRADELTSMKERKASLNPGGNLAGIEFVVYLERRGKSKGLAWVHQNNVPVDLSKRFYNSPAVANIMLAAQKRNAPISREQAISKLISPANYDTDIRPYSHVLADSFVALYENAARYKGKGDTGENFEFPSGPPQVTPQGKVPETPAYTGPTGPSIYATAAQKFSIPPAGSTQPMQAAPEPDDAF